MMAETSPKTGTGKFSNSENKYLIPVYPEVSEQLQPYLEPGQYPQPQGDTLEIVTTKDTLLISNTNDLLQAMAYWAIMAHVICEYSFASRVSKNRENFGRYLLQLNVEPMKIEYSNGERWYFDFVAVVLNGICSFIPIEYDVNVENEKITIDNAASRHDTVYTVWGKFLMPEKHTGYAYFDVLDKQFEKIAIDGVFSFTLQNFYVYIKLALKKVDPNYQRGDIFFRVPELQLDYDYSQISVQLACPPKFETEENDDSMMRPDLEKILVDFFATQIREKDQLRRRFEQNLINFVAPHVMRAQSVAQALCIFNAAISYRPAIFNKCSEIYSKIATDIFFLINDRKIRNYLIKLAKNLLPDSSTIWILNRAFFMKYYFTVDALQNFPSIEKVESDQRSFLMEEVVSMLQHIDNVVD